MRKLIIVLLAVSLFAACNNKKEADKTVTKDEKADVKDNKDDSEKPKDEEKTTSTWSSTEINAYLDNCIPAAQRNGLTKGQATDYCECTQKGLERMYPDPKDVAGLDLQAPKVQEMINKCNPLQ